MLCSVHETVQSAQVYMLQFLALSMSEMLGGGGGGGGGEAGVIGGNLSPPLDRTLLFITAKPIMRLSVAMSTGLVRTRILWVAH